MRRILPPVLLSVLFLAALPVFAQAEGDGDDLVRLPGQGLVKPDSAAAQDWPPCARRRTVCELRHQQ
jgi:hypothetical protein